jgi:hypothetical protein
LKIIKINKEKDLIEKTKLVDFAVTQSEFEELKKESEKSFKGNVSAYLRSKIFLTSI